GILYPFGIHPDHHGIVTNPNDPLQFFEANDGGVVRSSGPLVDRSVFCINRQLTGTDLTQCQALLSAIPKKLQSINKGLNTLQFQSLSVSPFNSKNVQGGTQDNGTWETKKKVDVWLNTMIGDGGQSGFDVGEKDFRFHTFFLGQADVNFKSGAVGDWNWVADPWFIAGEATLASFYIPIIHDPAVSKTLYAGLLHAWRTQTYGIGTMTQQEFRQHCNEWTGDFTVVCGDWEPLGDPSAAGQLTDASYGDRNGGFVAAVERTASDNSTLWAATSTGRVFVSSNADAVPASSVTFTRIDGFSIADPQRFVTGIYIDPANSNQAYVSYSGFSANTPTEPGHVFLVNYDPVGATATWTSLDGTGPGSLGDIPITDVVFDSATGDLYASNDFGVLREDAAAGINWQLAAPGMPNVETPGLTIVTADRKLYAATHGRGAWVLDLP
ncbi:exo-alpha-sialidase, partial [bacterium]|nr:exo-alpha-sialidase [bacterium]